MYVLKPNEKVTPVMAYTQNALIHGKVVTKEVVRINIWLRTEGAPNYLHLLDAQMIYLGGSAVKSFKYVEMFFPKERVIGFHPAPGVESELDYSEDEQNRQMTSVSVLLGSFLCKSKIRISSQTSFAASLEVARTDWLTIYDAKITNSYLPKMDVKVPLLLIRPNQAVFGLVER
ncbi:MAG: hypothetical protein B5M51_01830 [Anaerolinea sp. 4484_236]|nr:MAG: hypothetical protein B5M51_01830 [Anaerolinea sp. 4484_236]